MKKKTSIIWKISKNELQFTLDTSNSYSEVLLKLGFVITTGGPYRTLMERIKQENISIQKLNSNRKFFYKSNGAFKGQSQPLEEVLIENSNYSRNHLKKRIIANNILEYKCSLCNLQDIWNGRKISLHLDHINGINNDNRLENLRFLCPNCHSQTDTYSGKNKRSQSNRKNKCSNCNKEILTTSKYCRTCSPKIYRERKRKFEISKEELINLIKQYPMTKVGEILGVSDNAVRKRCKRLGIDYKNL